MQKYIVFTNGGKAFRFLIDAKLDDRLRISLQSDYRFDQNNYLILEKNNINETYKLKQKVLKELISSINEYDLPDALKKDVDVLKDYTANRYTVYNSDLSKLEELIGKAADIYGTARNSLQTKESAKEKKDKLEQNVVDFKDEAKSLYSGDDRINDFSSDTTEKIEDVKELLDDIKEDETLNEEIDFDNINDAINRIVICSSMEEYLDKVGHNEENVDIAKQIESKNEKIILPPNTKLDEVITNIIYHSCKDKVTFDKVVTYMSRKNDYLNKVNDSFEKLRSNLKVYQISARNLNYFGDQFIDEFERICNETGMSFETMFADYFNGYSSNRKYNSPMDKFMRFFLKYNGGDNKTREMLEAMLVKKAIAKHLISAKYNRYLSSDYRDISYNGNGYIRFDDNLIRNIGRESGINFDANDQIKSEMSTNNQKASSDFNSNAFSSTSFGTNIEANNSNEFNTNILNNREYIEANISGEQPRNSNDANENIDFDIKAINNIGTEEVGLNKNPLLRHNPIGGMPEAINIVNKNLVGSRNAFRNITLGVGARALLGNNSKDEIIEGSSDSTSSVGEYHNNQEFNSLVHDGIDSEDEIDSKEEGETELNETAQPESMAEATSSSDVNSSDDLPDNDNINSGRQDKAKKSKEKLKKVLKFIIKYKWLILGFGSILLLLLLIIIFFGGSGSNGSSSDDGSMGYYDSSCDFNSVKVTLNSCSDNSVIMNTDIQDAVKQLTYLYTKNKSYSEEVIKATMIALKTNILSYGGYQNGSSNLSVSLCNLYDKEETDNMFNGYDSKSAKLETAYNSISNYLFISSSYNSTINSLSTANTLLFDSKKLYEMENIPGSPSYEQILKKVYPNENNSSPSPANNNLFVGDSRTNGMKIAGYITDDNSIYATSQGYSWFSNEKTATGSGVNYPNGGINGVNSKLQDGKSYNIIIWLGVNDLGNIENYYNKYEELATKDWASHQLYIVSVGPVDDNKTGAGVKNSAIDNFNNTMKDKINSSGISNLHYIDLNFTTSDISNYDNMGVHYGSNDYGKVYQRIIQSLGATGQNRDLYNLSDYCSYYTLTENDAYWWPVGSEEATKGNIYGGDPVSVKISSYFGARPNVAGASGSENHKAIDIPVREGTPVIATKDGIIDQIQTGYTSPDLNAKNNASYGNFIKIKHGGDDDIYSLYAHLSQVLVSKGESVKQGQIIGYSGNTGRSTGPHLHFEIRIGPNTRVNPLDYVSADNPRPVSTKFNIIDDGDYSDPEKNKEIIAKTLLNSGYSKNAVIGMLINIQAEGNFRTNNLENCYEENKCCKINGKNYGFCVHPEIKGYGSDTLYTKGVDSGAYLRDKFVNDRAGYGLIQWTSSNRKAGLYDLAKEKNKSISNINVQLEWLLKEIENPSYKETKKAIENTTMSAYDISVIFCKDFESPNNMNEVCKQRTNSNLESMEEYINSLKATNVNSNDNNNMVAVLDNMSIEEKISQMIIMRYDGSSPDQNLKNHISKYGLGGVILFAENINSQASTKNAVSSMINSTDIPLIVSVDQEGGNVQRLKTLSDATPTIIPNMYSLGSTNDTNLAYNVGKVMAEELRTIGVNVDFAPVLDIYSNPNNTVIGKRSFGSTADVVSNMAISLAKGLEDNGVIAVYKHFPGHGDTQTDSHINLPVINKTYNDIKNLELKPFISAINNNAKIIMVGHLAFPNVVGDNTPTSLSKKLITDILKKDLGYDGLVITDALDMGALSKNYNEKEIVVKAVNAGVDLLLMPNSLDKTINYIKESVSEERINESVKKILDFKFQYLKDKTFLDKSILGSEEHKSIISKIPNI